MYIKNVWGKFWQHWVEFQATDGNVHDEDDDGEDDDDEDDDDEDERQQRRRFRRYVEVSRPKSAPVDRIPTTYSGTGDPHVRPRPSRLFSLSPSQF